MSTKCDKTAARGLASGGSSEIRPASEADLPMNPGGQQTVESFAIKFTHLEWKYLCSYRWFLEDFAQAVETGDFFSLQVKAERALVYGRVRRPARTTKDDLSVCHSAKWYG
jgi:hypothetical protein